MLVLAGMVSVTAAADGTVVCVLSSTLPVHVLAGQSLSLSQP
jgi:hypothetical protein